jgi:hypothetical protein
VKLSASTRIEGLGDPRQAFTPSIRLVDSWLSTGDHHRNVIHLTFDGGRSVR